MSHPEDTVRYALNLLLTAEDPAFHGEARGAKAALDALLARAERAEAVVRAAKGVRYARQTYMGVAQSEWYYERLFSALAALDAEQEADEG